MEIDHEFTDNIVCPYCGYARQGDEDYEEHEDECYKCGKAFLVTPDYSVTYTTSKIDDDMKASPQ